MKTVGIISDTHGLLRAEACTLLTGSDLIVHAGDIGKPGIVEVLAELAPVKAIRGNIDRSDELRQYPERDEFEFENRSFFVLHDLNELEADLIPGRYDIVISGHSHIAKIEERNNVMYINPGSAGPRRFKLPVTLAILKLHRKSATVSIETVIQ